MSNGFDDEIIFIPEEDLRRATPEEVALYQGYLQRQLLLRSPADFAEYISKGKYDRPPHIEVLNDALVRIARGELKRLMVTMPPRHGKSETCSKYFPAWYLTRFPDKRVMLAAYEAEFAASWGRKARDIVEQNPELGIQLSRTSSAANRWEIANHTGGMVTAGVGGSLTGRGADILIIDDPVKNDEEAASPTIRQKHWDWYRGTAFTRLEPGGSVIIIQTRWHEDDLAGRLLEHEGDEWEVVNFPAIAEDDDILGRTRGEALWPERYPVDELEAIRKTSGPYRWSALYQQRPQPEGGGLFKREGFRYWRRMTDSKVIHLMASDDGVGGERFVEPDEMWSFVTVDLAASTKTRADWTVAAAWGVVAEPPGLILLDVVRARLEGPDHLPMIRSLYERVKPKPHYIGIERATFGLTLIQEANRAGLPVRELKPDKDKVSRALPAAVRVEAGQVYLPKNLPILDVLENELLGFPNATHDDFVDVLSYAALEMARGVNMRRKKKPKQGSSFDDLVRQEMAALDKPKKRLHNILGRF